jgi:hypothetical protein
MMLLLLLPSNICKLMRKKLATGKRSSLLCLAVSDEQGKEVFKQRHLDVVDADRVEEVRVRRNPRYRRRRRPDFCRRHRRRAERRVFADDDGARGFE